MVSIKDYGIDKLPEDQRLELANQIWESLTEPPPGIWDEAELKRRNAAARKRWTFTQSALLP